MNASTSRSIKITLLAAYSAAALALMSVLGVHAAGIPESVTGLSATPIDTASVGLSWNTAKDGDGGPVDHYRVYYGATSVQTVGAGEYDTTLDTPGNSASYIVGGLTTGTTYYFAVTALNADGEESELYSQEAGGATKGGGEAVPEEEVVPEPLAEAVVPEEEPVVEDPVAEELIASAEDPAADVTAPMVATVEALTKTKVKVTFSEAIQLPAVVPETAFVITGQVNPLNDLEVKSVAPYQENADSPVDDTAVSVTTADQARDVNYVLTVGVTVADLAGNTVKSGNQDSGLFIGTDRADPLEVVADTTPPEDVTNLLLSFKEQLDRFAVLLDWIASVNTAKDLVDQVLYMSLDRGVTYGAGQSLGADVTHAEKGDLEGGKEYTFKLTTKDDSGNESTGVVKSIRLPQTGVGIGIFLLGSAAVAGQVLRRKRK